MSDEELHELFEALAVVDEDQSKKMVSKAAVSTKFHSALNGMINSDEIDQLVNQFWVYETEELRKVAGNEDMEITKIAEEDFVGRLKKMGQQVDSRMMPLAMIFLASGVSIGVIIPVMPQLAQTLDLSTTQYGTIVGAFAFTKMIGNIPAAKAVERFGCKPILSATTVGMGAAIGSIGLAESYEALVLCRFAGGACIAGFVSAAFVYLADISNPLNRGSTIAPPSTAFTAGTALGPAVGGGLHAYLDIHQTFFAAGAMIGVVGVATHLMLKPPAVLRSQQDLELEAQKLAGGAAVAGDAVEQQSVFQQWARLMKVPGILSMTSELYCGFSFLLPPF